MTSYARAARECALLLAVLACVLADGLVVCGTARADGGPQIATATTQDLLDPVRGLSVVWHGKRVSALPFRIRLLDQASPLAYSLDIRRPTAYGDSWTGISLGSPADPQARSLPAIGIPDPLTAEAIARGDAPAGKSAVPATTDKGTRRPPGRHLGGDQQHCAHGQDRAGRRAAPPRPAAARRRRGHQRPAPGRLPLRSDLRPGHHREHRPAGGDDRA